MSVVLVALSLLTYAVTLYSCMRVIDGGGSRLWLAPWFVSLVASCALMVAAVRA